MALEAWDDAKECFMKAINFNPMNAGLSQSMSKAAAGKQAADAALRLSQVSPAPNPGPAAAASSPEPSPTKAVQVAKIPMIQELRLAFNSLCVQVTAAVPSAEVEAVAKAMVEAGAPGVFSDASQNSADSREPAAAYHAVLHEVVATRNYRALTATELRQQPAATAAVIGTLEAGKQICSSHLVRTPAPASHRVSCCPTLAHERNAARCRSERIPAAVCTSAA
jgi:hypothetical protein